MARYPYTCESCEHEWDLTMSMSAERPDSPGCPGCGGVDTRRVWTTPNWVVKGNRKGETLYAPDKPGRNQAQGFRTVAQQEQAHKEVFAKKKAIVRENARQRRSSIHKDGNLRLKASIPAELFRSVQRTTGNTHVWADEGMDLIKKHGLNFED